jgi:hypothetical protein
MKNHAELVEPETPTTYISADMTQLYDRAFFDEHEPTRTSRVRPDPNLKRTAEWTRLARRTAEPQYYNTEIVRFYESIIAELQKELARYREMLSAADAVAAAPEGEYSRGPGSVGDPLASRLMGVSAKGASLEGHEL